MAYHDSRGLRSRLTGMQAKTHIAVGTLRYFSAGFALKHRRPCSARAEYHDLSTVPHRLLDSGKELSGEVSDHSVLPPFRPGVDYLDLDVLGAVISFFETDQFVPSELAVVQFLQRRSR